MCFGRQAQLGQKSWIGPKATARGVAQEWRRPLPRTEAHKG